MELRRFKRTKTTVLGVLKDDNGGTYFTCENAVKAIPAGNYSVVKNFSMRFAKMLPLIYSDSVPASRGIRFHEGNSYSDSEGCILVGNNCDLNKCTIADSRAATAQLLKSIGQGDIKHLQIIE